MRELTHQKVWNFLETCPEDVKDFLLSYETSITIFDMCENLGIDDNTISNVSKYITLSVMGEIPKEELALAFELDLGIPSDASKKLVLEIEEKIFSKIKIYYKQKQATKQEETSNFSKQKHIFKDNYKEDSEQ